MKFDSFTNEIYDKIMELSHSSSTTTTSKQPPNTVLFNKYSTNSSLPAHSDNEHSLDMLAPIYAISLGTEAQMCLTPSKFLENTFLSRDEFIPKREKLMFKLPSRSLLVMSGAAQFLWRHQILPLNTNGTPNTIETCTKQCINKPNESIHVNHEAVRVSLTFRTVKSAKTQEEDKPFLRHELYNKLASIPFENYYGRHVDQPVLRSNVLDQWYFEQLHSIHSLN